MSMKRHKPGSIFEAHSNSILDHAFAGFKD